MAEEKLASAAASPLTTDDLSIKKKPVKKFKSQSVNDLFKPPAVPSGLGPAAHNVATSQLASSALSLKSDPNALDKTFSTASVQTAGVAEVSSFSTSLGQAQALQRRSPAVSSTGGIKTLSLLSGPKLKIIPDKRLTMSMNSGAGSVLNSETANSVASRLINDENNYWKKSRSTSPDIKRDKMGVHPTANSTANTHIGHSPANATNSTSNSSSSTGNASGSRKIESSRFTFANLSVPLSSTGFNWADIDDDDDDSFNDKIWSSLTRQLDFPLDHSSSTSTGTTAPTTSNNTNNTLNSTNNTLSTSTTTQPHPAARQPSSLLSPNLDTSTNNEIFSPLGDHHAAKSPVTTPWASTSPMLGFRTSSLNFPDSDSKNYYSQGQNHAARNGSNPDRHHSHPQLRSLPQPPLNFRSKFTSNSLSTSLENLSFQESRPLPGNDPIKQELFNPLTGKMEVFHPETGPASKSHANDHKSIGTGTNTGTNTNTNSNTHPNSNTNSNTNPPQIHHHSFDSSYINHNIGSGNHKFWNKSNTVWNSRENSLANSLQQQFSPNLNDSLSSPGWSHNFDLNDHSASSPSNSNTGMLTTPNTLRGLSRFFPSPRGEHGPDYFQHPPPLQTSSHHRRFPHTNDSVNTSSNSDYFRLLKRPSVEVHDPLSLAVADSELGKTSRKLNFDDGKSKIVDDQAKEEFHPRSIDSLFEKQLEEGLDEDTEIVLSLPSVKSVKPVSTSRECIGKFVLSEGIKHPEGFSSTFYKRGVNNFMFVRELQSKVAINKIRGYDYLEFRINIPISNKSLGKLMLKQDSTQPSRIKRSYIINIDVKELEGKSAAKRPNGSGNKFSSYKSGVKSGKRSNVYIRKGVR